MSSPQYHSWPVLCMVPMMGGIICQTWEVQKAKSQIAKVNQILYEEIFQRDGSVQLQYIQQVAASVGGWESAANTSWSYPGTELFEISVKWIFAPEDGRFRVFWLHLCIGRHWKMLTKWNVFSNSELRFQ